ncbi:MAG: three-Cys-motif partner protein TcmP [Chloroflexota bacterium]
MSDAKYSWRVGSPPPTIDRHSETKHRIVEEYVRRYILTLMSQVTIPNLQLSLIDGFCGGGSYLAEDGSIADGSPLLMLRAVREARALLNRDRRVPRGIHVDYSFIDIIPDTTQHLQYLLNARREESAVDEEDIPRIEITTGAFLSVLPTLVKKIQARHSGEHAIFVLDQYNYNDLPLPQIKNILHTLKGAEVIMTFNVGSLITYLSDRVENRKPLVKIGLDDYVPWAELNQLKATEKKGWRQIIQRHLAYGIRKETGAKFMTLFFVKPWGSNTWDYWLIHLSNRYRAHEVMKAIHWDYGTNFGHDLGHGIFMLGYDANADSGYTGQDSLDFGEGSREACVDSVREHFGKTVFSLGNPVSVGDLFQSCVSNSTAAENHLLDATRQLHACKDIVVVSKDGTVRRPSKNYRPDDVIEPSRQLILLPR